MFIAIVLIVILDRVSLCSLAGLEHVVILNLITSFSSNNEPSCDMSGFYRGLRESFAVTGVPVRLPPSSVLAPLNTDPELSGAGCFILQSYFKVSI